MTHPSSDPNQPLPPRLIVALGASAGGLAAIEAFFDNMCSDSGFAFVVLSHHMPGSVSLMPELVAKRTSMKVEFGSDGQRLEANCVYVAPTGAALGIADGKFIFGPLSDISRPHATIDHFFGALAVDQGPRAVGIVLSGAGADGSAGVRAIREESGTTIAQRPETAQFPPMPSAAIATRQIAHVLAPEQMPALLLELPALAPKPGESLEIPKTLPPNLGSILSLLRVHTGHDFSGYKPNTLLRRIQRRMVARGVQDARAYLEHLRAEQGEVQNLFAELMIGVTSFFRDPEAFAALSDALRDSLRTSEISKVVRGWVAGCSSGEEAYSLAIVLRDLVLAEGRNHTVRIFATDIDTRALSIARAGAYSTAIAEEMPRERLARSFVEMENRYQVRSELREMMSFAAHNLILDPPFTRIDVLCCRNVLIYLDAKVQRDVLALFHYALNPGGVLFLGSAETLGAFAENWIPVNKRWNVFRKKEVSPRAWGGAPFRRHSDPFALHSTVSHSNRVGVTAMAESLLANTLIGPSVIVDEHGQILHIHGRTGEFLEPSPGEPSMNVFRMAREGLRAELSAAVRQSIAGERSVVALRNLKIKSNDDFMTADVRVCRVNHTPFGSQAFIIVFERQRAMEPAPHETGDEPGPGEGKFEGEVRALKETLHSTIEEYETANEELKASNEELQSANEELQSANEELETSKEEQQSLNEELQTLNAELKEKVEDLSRAHDDMRNLLNSTDVATIFLDASFRIKRFTPGATRIASLIQSDVGRPISDLGTKVEVPSLLADMEEVLQTLVFKQREVTGSDGASYFMRILPYRTAENVIDGVVLTFVDVTELKQFKQQAAQERQIVERLVRSVPDPLVVLDADRRVIVANPAFVDLTGARTEFLEGMVMTKILPELEPELSGQPEHGNGGAGRRLVVDVPQGRKGVLVRAERLSGDGQSERTLVSFTPDETEKGGSG